MDSHWAFLAVLFLLSFMQGLPHGLQFSTLPAVFRMEGLDFKHLSHMKMLFVPWIIKPVYAPMIDNYLNRYIWMMFTIIGMGAVCFLAAHNLHVYEAWNTILMLITMNVFTTWNDVAVNALAVRVLDTNQLRGAGATVQLIGYRMGSLFAGTFFIIFYINAGWRGMFTTIAVLFAIGLQIVIWIGAFKANDRKHPHPPDYNMDGQIAALKEALNQTPSNVWIWGGYFLNLFKVSERVDMSFSTYLVTKVGKNAATTWLSPWARVMKEISLAGTIYGGYEMYKRGTKPKELLVKYSYWRSLAVLAQFSCMMAWGQDPYPSDAEPFSFDWLMLYSGLVLQNAVLFYTGAVTSSMLTMLFSLTQRTATYPMQGIHIALLTSFEFMSRMNFATVDGYYLDKLREDVPTYQFEKFMDSLGVEFSFFLFCCASLMTIPVLHACPKPLFENDTAVVPSVAAGGGSPGASPSGANASAVAPTTTTTSDTQQTNVGLGVRQSGETTLQRRHQHYE